MSSHLRFGITWPVMVRGSTKTQEAISLDNLLGSNGRTEVIRILDRPRSAGESPMTWHKTGTNAREDNVYAMTIPREHIGEKLVTLGVNAVRMELTISPYVAEIERRAEWTLPEGQHVAAAQVESEMQRLCNRQVNMLLANVVADRMRTQIADYVGEQMRQTVRVRVGEQLKDHLRVHMDHRPHVQQISALFTR